MHRSSDLGPHCAAGEVTTAMWVHSAGCCAHLGSLTGVHTNARQPARLMLVTAASTPPQGLKRERQEAAQGGGDGVAAAAADDAVDMTDI